MRHLSIFSFASAGFLRSFVLALACLVAWNAHALVVEDYSPEAVKAAQAKNKPHVLVFHADWCPTCKAQAKAFEQLKSDPALKNITLYNVDFDGEHDLKKQLKVRGQSTLIAYKGGKETYRSTGETNSDALKAALSKSL